MTERAERSGDGMPLFEHHPAGLKVRVVAELVQAQSGRAGHVKLTAQLDPFALGAGAEDALQLVQEIRIVAEVGDNRVVMFGDEIRSTDGVAEALPEPLLLRTEEDVF